VRFCFIESNKVATADIAVRVGGARHIGIENAVVRVRIIIVRSTIHAWINRGVEVGFIARGCTDNPDFIIEF